ncbi:MAG: hypothetical protein EU529_10650 [Promethearchaeota archaeon]|nr:MAG: hypothetical protein EU529_10650 [Candidatus Lokiarchaeota archaeon]
MNSEKIYPLFLKKLENQVKNQILENFNADDKSVKAEKFRIIISFKDISKRDEFILKNKNLVILKQFDLIPSISLNLTRDQIQTIQNNNLIKRIEEDQKLYLSMLHVIEDIGLNNYRRSKKPYLGKNIIIGIIDNGINQVYDSFKGVKINHYSLIEHNKKEKITHGTLMANIIVNQFQDENKNIIGIAPDAKIIDFDISNSKEQYFFSDILGVFDYIIQNNIKVDILLIPFTTLHPSDGKDSLSLCCNLLVDKGFIIVCPAGNFGPESYTIGSPSAAEKVFTIGSYTKDKKISYFSGRGPTLDERIKPDFCLPGSKIEIPLSEGVRVRLSGTSVSAAICAGLIALIKESNPKMSYPQIFTIIKKACITLGYQNISQGSGTILISDIFKTIKVKKGKDKEVETIKKEEKLVSYNHIMLKALGISIEYFIFFIILFYLIYYFDFILRWFIRIFGVI